MNAIDLYRKAHWCYLHHIPILPKCLQALIFQVILLQWQKIKVYICKIISIFDGKMNLICLPLCL